MPAKQPKQPFVIGLTGGIASGKSTVAENFRELGATIVDTDVIAREVVAPGQPALAEIQASFGDGVIAADGNLDRKAMRSIIFADEAKRKELELILHPRIRQEASRRVSNAKGPYQMVVVPLLVKSPMKSDMQRILVVDCSEEIQIARLLERDTECDEQARRMVASQASRIERLTIADDVILNDDDLAQTRRQVEALHTQYLALAREYSD